MVSSMDDLEGIAEADEEAVGLQSEVVALVEVEQAKTIATEEVEVVELYIGAEHGVKVKAALVAIVAVPISGGSGSQKGLAEFCGTSDGQTWHRTDEGIDGQFTVHSNFIVEQNRHIDKELCFVGCTGNAH